MSHTKQPKFSNHPEVSYKKEVRYSSRDRHPRVKFRLLHLWSRSALEHRTSEATVNSDRRSEKTDINASLSAATCSGSEATVYCELLCLKALAVPETNCNYIIANILLELSIYAVRALWERRRLDRTCSGSANAKRNIERIPTDIARSNPNDGDASLPSNRLSPSGGHMSTPSPGAAVFKATKALPWVLAARGIDFIAEYCVDASQSKESDSIRGNPCSKLEFPFWTPGVGARFCCRSGTVIVACQLPADQDGSIDRRGRVSLESPHSVYLYIEVSLGRREERVRTHFEAVPVCPS